MNIIWCIGCLHELIMLHQTNGISNNTINISMSINYINVVGQARYSVANNSLFIYNFTDIPQYWANTLNVPVISDRDMHS